MAAVKRRLRVKRFGGEAHYLEAGANAEILIHNVAAYERGIDPLPFV
jgi:hypothetical protein